MTLTVRHYIDGAFTDAADGTTFSVQDPFSLETIGTQAAATAADVDRAIASAENAFGLWPALLLASLLFGLAHAMTLTYLVLATLMGLYLGALYAWTDQLLAPMLTHFLYDWAALAWLLRKR